MRQMHIYPLSYYEHHIIFFFQLQGMNPRNFEKNLLNPASPAVEQIIEGFFTGKECRPFFAHSDLTNRSGKLEFVIPHP